MQDDSFHKVIQERPITTDLQESSRCSLAIGNYDRNYGRIALPQPVMKPVCFKGDRGTRRRS